MTSITIVFEATTTKNVRLDDIVLKGTKASGKTPTTVTINGSPSTEVYMGDAVTSPSGASVKAGGSEISTAVTWSSSNTNAATINSSTGAIALVGPGSTTIKATFAETNTHNGSEASYELKVYGVFATMAEIQAGCAAYGKTAMKGKVTLNNVYVTAVKNNNAYISDGTNGAVIYKSDHGFVAGDKLACSALEVTMMNYNDYTPEITSLTNTTEGLTVTGGQTITPTTMAVAAITKANFGTLVKISDVTYDKTAGAFKDGNNSIAYYDNFAATPTLNDGEKYDVTGVIIFKNSTTLEICPRTAADVVAKTVKTTPTSVWKVGGNVVTSIAVTKGSAFSPTFETNSSGTKSFESSKPAVATVNNTTGAISLTGTAGIATITASTASNNSYYSSSATLTIIVGEPVEDGVFNFGGFQDYGSGIVPGEDYYTTASTWTAGNIALNVSGRYRWYIASSGKPDFRFYANETNTMTFTVPEGYYITKIDSLSSSLTADVGTLSSSTWTGKSQSVTFTTSSAVTFNKIIPVYYSGPTISVTMGEAGWMTYYNVGAALSFEGVTAYKVSSIAEDHVNLMPVTEAPANTPVLLKAAPGAYNLKVVESAEKVGTNSLRVSDGTKTSDENYNIYALAKKNGAVGFYKVQAGVMVPAGKCYLSVKLTAPDSARDFLGFNGEDATRVNAVENGQSTGVVFDLQGRQVKQPTKGLYIKNGKKVIIK